MLSMHPDLQTAVALARHRRRTAAIEQSVSRRGAMGAGATEAGWPRQRAPLAQPALQVLPGASMSARPPRLRVVKTPAA
jgi:hypothetical protein